MRCGEEFFLRCWLEVLRCFEVLRCVVLGDDDLRCAELRCADLPCDAPVRFKVRELALRTACSVLRRLRVFLSSCLRTLLLRAGEVFFDEDCDEEAGRLDAPRLEPCPLPLARRAFFSLVIVSRYHSRLPKTHTTLGRGRLVRCSLLLLTGMRTMLALCRGVTRLRARGRFLYAR